MTPSHLTQRLRKLLPGFAVIALLSAGMLAQSLRSQLATDREILAAQITRQLLQVAEGLAIYSEFSGESLKRETPTQIRAGLNRLIYGQPGALRLAVARRSGELIANSFSAKGDYIGEETPLPPCLTPHRPALADLRKYGELTIRICSSSTLLIERLIERDDRVLGSLQAFVDLNEISKEILKTAALRHHPEIRLNTSDRSSELACRSTDDDRALCIIETGALGWIDALPDALITLVLILIVMMIALLILRRFVLIPFSTVFAVLERVSKNTPIPGATIEVGGILSRLQGPLRNLNEMAASNIRLREESAASRVRTEVAQQVAHDIRSPLAALQSVDPELKALPENTRVLLRNAVQRISDIAHHLQSRDPKDSPKRQGVQLLSILIDELMSEKRAQFRARQGQLELSTWISPEASILFVKLDSAEFKRAISNLVNNAVESIESAGRVRVALTVTDEDRVRVEIRDDGGGIPDEILTRLGERGVTTKPEGQGIGIAHALKTVAEAGGQIEFKRRSPRGTEVLIELPVAPPPPWFPGEVRLPEKGPSAAIVAIDDDRSIHSIWSRRLAFPDYERIHCATSKDFEELLQRRPILKQSAIFLMDQEFAGDPVTGLTLIERHGIASRSTLITSRFEDPDVVAGCKSLGVKLLPKGLAGFIPICTADAPPVLDLLDSPEIILVDDDPMVRMTWTLAAKNAQKKLQTFASPEEFRGTLDELDRSIPIYLDQELGGGVTGVELGDELCKQGFTNLHLATGREASTLPSRPWMRSIRDKTPPW